jgi:hypothetical protein
MLCDQTWRLDGAHSLLCQTMFFPYHRQLKVLSAVTGVSFALFTSARAQDYDFVGTTSSDPTDSSNYTSGATPFVTGGTTASIDNFSVNNTPAHNPLVYTSALGTTTFTGGGDLRVGNDGNGASEMDVTGGNLTITTAGGNSHDTLGYRAPGTIGVSGGTFTLGTNSNDLWVGNENSGTINVSGSGTFNVLDSLLISRDGGGGTINISGNGLLNAESTTGTTFGTSNAGGPGLINLTGNGVYEQTGSGSIALGGNFKVNFGTGSSGEFSLHNADTRTLDGYITSGDIEINGAVDMTLSDFTVGSSGSQGFIELAVSSVPEPSTWCMAALLAGTVVCRLAVAWAQRNSPRSGNRRLQDSLCVV